MQAFYSQCSLIKLPDGTIVAPHSTKPFFNPVLKSVLQANTKKARLFIVKNQTPVTTLQRDSAVFFRPNHPPRHEPKHQTPTTNVALQRCGILFLISGVGAIGITVILLPSPMMAIGLSLGVLSLIAGAACIAMSRSRRLQEPFPSSLSIDMEHLGTSS